MIIDEFDRKPVSLWQCKSGDIVWLRVRRIADMCLYPAVTTAKKYKPDYLFNKTSVVIIDRLYAPIWRRMHDWCESQYNDSLAF